MIRRPRATCRSISQRIVSHTHGIKAHQAKSLEGQKLHGGWPRVSQQAEGREISWKLKVLTRQSSFGKFVPACMCKMLSEVSLAKPEYDYALQTFRGHVPWWFLALWPSADKCHACEKTKTCLMASRIPQVYLTRRLLFNWAVKDCTPNAIESWQSANLFPPTLRAEAEARREGDSQSLAASVVWKGTRIHVWDTARESFLCLQCIKGHRFGSWRLCLKRRANTTL